MYFWIVRAVCVEMWRSPSRWIIIALLLSAALALVRADRLFFRDPKLELQNRRNDVRNRLAKQGVALLYTADTPPGQNWASGQPARIAGTRAVQGRFGTALEFDGGRRTFVRLPLKWSDLGSTFTVSLWINLNPASPDQEILFTRDSRAMGLKLDRGQLAFFSASTGAVQAAHYTFTNYNRFVHIAAVVEADAGRIRLYEDGALRATLEDEPFRPAEGILHIGAANTTLIAEPLQGAVDDVVIWKHALTDAEVAAWAQGEQPALQRLAGREVEKLNRIDTFRNAYSHLLKLADRFNPALHAGKIQRAPLPQINLALSKKDARFFLKADRASRKNGRRTDSAAQPRRVDVLDGQHSFTGFLRLDGSDSAYPASIRRSYVLEVQDGETILGFRRIRLQPPESADWLAPILETRVARELNLPAISNGFCRLLINGEFAGLYYFEDYTHLGVPPGETSERLQGVTRRKEWQHVGISKPPRIERARLIELCNETDRAFRNLIRSDYTSPLSSREIVAKLRDSKNRLKQLPLAEPLRKTRGEEMLATLSPWLVIGTNPAPLFILYDLPLPRQLPDGTPLTWTSSNPDIISESGRVTRPTNNTPTGVTLTAHITGTHSDAAIRTLDFRVMPRNRTVSAVFLWAAAPLDRIRRVDCATEVYPAGSDTTVQRYYAAQDGRAGIAMRGHTSLRQLKRPFSLRLSEPHGWWGTTNETKLRFVNPWRDPSFLHNWFFYSRFAAFADTPDRVRVGMPVTWVEVFANGNYFGLYEVSPSIRNEWLGFPDLDDADPNPALLYKAAGGPPSLSPDGEYFMRQLEPSRRKGVFLDPELELHRLIMQAPADQFTAQIGQQLDLDNLTDFHILLDFSENYNGYPFKFAIHDLLARPPGADAKFFLIPYDFDNTYGHTRYPLYHSIVFSRMLKEYPGYAERLAARWWELRRSVLDLDAMERDIREHAQSLTGYVEWDDRRWDRYRDNPYDNRVDEFIAHVRRRVGELDQRYKAARPEK